MPVKWSDHPPEQNRGQSMPLIRTPQNGTMQGVVSSHTLIGCQTHFWGGRTYPCLGDNCPACNQASPWRWHGYLSAKSPQTSLHFLFETTAGGAEAFTEYRRLHGTLRGCHFLARRHNGSANGQVLIQTKISDIDPRFIPPAPNLIELLSRLWNLPVESQQLIDHLAQEATARNSTAQLTETVDDAKSQTETAELGPQNAPTFTDPHLPETIHPPEA